MPLKTQLDDQPGLNMTPMMDVIFLLLIFFLVGTKLSESERKIGLEVPSVTENGALTAAPAKRIVNVYRDGSITLDRKPITREELVSVLAAAQKQYSDLGVLVRGDADGPFQNVAEVLNACKKAGIAELGISVRLASAERMKR
jgi:biopolymer transport protein ExbD